ncbi:MAG TPA: TIGR04551 family protein [Myxococcota bacterium]|jgi:uncharacterized protein (TIGR04551 family)|nr:TIGR04551 family protein [Myxococcota bacterium]
MAIRRSRKALAVSAALLAAGAGAGAGAWPGAARPAWADEGGAESAPESGPDGMKKPPALPPTLRPLPPLGSDAGAGAGDTSKIVDEFKLGTKGLAKPKLQFFELHGYFRWRTDLFQNLDLRAHEVLPLVASGNYRPQALDFSATGFPVILPLSERDDSADLASEPGNRDIGRGAETLAGTNIRLRLDPTINVSEILRIKATIDVLDNVVLGSTPDGYVLAAGASLRPADVPILAFSGSEVPPDGRNSFSDSIRVKRAWAEVRTPYGELRFGRMGSHWGLGLLANDGNCLDCDYGDSADRIMFATKLNRFVIVPAIDIPVSGFTSARVTDYGGQAYDLDQLDDVHQYILAVARRDTPEELAAMALRGETSFNYGLYFVFRNMSFSGAELATAVGASNDPDYTLYKVNAEAYIPDLWGRLVTGPLTLEAEAVFIYGKIESNPLMSGANCGDPTADISMPGTPEYRRGICKVIQFGAALHASYKMLDDKLTIRFRGGVATGDEGEGLVPVGTLVTHAADSRLTAFRFDRDYIVDLILFRQILGTISGAAYFNLGGTYEALPGLNLKLDAIYSLAVEPVSTPGNKPGLGVEVDGEVNYTTKDGFFGAVQGGILFPLKGLNFPDAIYGGAWPAEVGDVVAKPAFTLQGFLGIRY